MGGRRLLAIFAHPDDESFGPGGTLARYAREGVEVHVCTVTDGAAGSYRSSEAPDGGMTPLGRLRRQELACACEILGVRLHTLDYRDSGMEGAADNKDPDSLYQADLDVVAWELVRIMREVRPHVVITHDPSGGYFHPDHMKVSQAVSCAWEKVGDVRVDPESRGGGLEPWQPARLYHTALPRSMLKWFIRLVRLSRQDPRRFGQNKDIDLTQVGVPDEQFHVRLDVGAYMAIKEQASACHKSQGGGGVLRMFPGFARRRWLGYEHFVQAWPPGAGAHGDLFEGVEFGE